MGSRSPAYSYENPAGDSLGTTDEDLQEEAKSAKSKAGKGKDGDLPDTQPIEEGEGAVVWKRTKSNQQQPWGMLLSEDSDYFDNVPLVGNEIFCGKLPEHQCKLDSDKIQKDCWIQFSREHFKIERVFESDQPDCSSEPADVYITDFSMNGTFINEERLEKNEKRAILNNDTIAMTSYDRQAYKFVLFTPEPSSQDLNSSQQSSTNSTSYPSSSALPPDLKIKYVVGRKLGNGACGSAYLAYAKHEFDSDKRPKKYCVKVIGNNSKSLPPAASSQYRPTRPLLNQKVPSREGAKYSSSSRGTLGSSGSARTTTGATSAAGDTSDDSFMTPRKPQQSTTLRPFEATNDVNFNKIHKSEIDILKHLNDRNKSHPNIIGFVEAYECPTSIAIVFELARGGELFDYIVEDFTKNAFEERSAKIQFYQILSGIKYLHDNNVCHRDLKLENILCCERNKRGLIKITDFGLSKLLLNQCPMTTYVGTPCYIAPEVIVNNTETDSKKHNPYTIKADMWSLGCILYSLLCGSSAFHPEGNDDKMLKEQILQAAYVMDSNIHPIWANVSWQAKDLIDKLLVVNPDRRLSATEALNHPWFTDDPDTVEEVEKIMDRGRRHQVERGLSEVSALADSMDIVTVDVDPADVPPEKENDELKVTPPKNDELKVTPPSCKNRPAPLQCDTPDNRRTLVDQHQKTETKSYTPGKRKAISEVKYVPGRRGPKRTLLK